MPPLSVGRQFFDRIVEDVNPVAAIRRLIDPNNPTFETDWLDFKGEYRGDPKQREKSNRGNWSEYLSAFANTGGGVLLWGIDARRKEVGGRELDFAGAEALVTDPVGLASKLSEWQGQATSPPLSGVVVRPYPVPEDANRGFLVCFVPEGSLKPYQALQTADRQYYLRGGGSNFVMDRAVLASMFHPRPKAVFRAKADLEYKPAVRITAAQLLCRLSLLNSGTATAKEVSVRVTWDDLPGKKVNMNEVGGSCWSNRDREFCFTSRTVFHPGIEFQVYAGLWNLDGGIEALVIGDQRPVVRGYIDLTIYIQDQMPQTIRVAFDLKQLIPNGTLAVDASPEE